MTLVAAARELRRRGAYDTGSRRPTCCRCSISWRLPPSPTSCRCWTLNRAFVVKGLEVMRQRQNTGLRALLDAASLNQPPTPYHLGFVLGPRINAGGRIGDAALGARLLSIDDEVEAARIAALLDKLNRERKVIETAHAGGGDGGGRPARRRRSRSGRSSSSAHPNGTRAWSGWSQPRLVERFRRPACVIAWEETGQGTASLRSIAGVDIGAAVRSLTAEGLLVKGGGHAMAAGLTLAPDMLDAVRARFDTMLRDTSSKAPRHHGFRDRRRIDIGWRIRRAASA